MLADDHVASGVIVHRAMNVTGCLVSSLFHIPMSANVRIPLLLRERIVVPFHSVCPCFLGVANYVCDISCTAYDDPLNVRKGCIWYGLLEIAVSVGVDKMPCNTG